MLRFHLAPLAWLVLGTAAVACQPAPPEVEEQEETGSTSTSSGSGSTGSIPSSTGASTGIASSSASGEDGTTTSGVADSTGSDGGTTVGLEDSGSSSTGEPSSVGCADGTREDLVDEAAYPSIAACSGGFWIPGVNLNTPLCDRQGGNDGPFPDGMGCSIDDLCAAGWHVCTSRYEVMEANLDCGSASWANGFFATGQSGEGANTCDDTGTNDVFGCGNAGYPNINGCAPLNRSTSNECVKLAGPWSCADPYDEVSTLAKTGSEFGGALCCLDAP